MKPSRNCHSMRVLRAARHAEGLSSKGFERVNKSHPDLAGLDRKTYQRRYMAWQRAEDRKGFERVNKICDKCNGSGIQKGSNAQEWETYLEPCDACGGLGKNNPNVE